MFHQRLSPLDAQSQKILMRRTPVMQAACLAEGAAEGPQDEAALSARFPWFTAPPPDSLGPRPLSTQTPEIPEYWRELPTPLQATPTARNPSHNEILPFRNGRSSAPLEAVSRAGHSGMPQESTRWTLVAGSSFHRE